MSWFKPRSAAELRLANRRFNEQLKQLSSTFSNAGLATVGGAFIVPATSGSAEKINGFWFFIGILLVVAGQCVLGLMRSEE